MSFLPMNVQHVVDLLAANPTMLREMMVRDLQEDPSNDPTKLVGQQFAPFITMSEQEINEMVVMPVGGMTPGVTKGAPSPLFSFGGMKMSRMGWGAYREKFMISSEDILEASRLRQVLGEQAFQDHIFKVIARGFNALAQRRARRIESQRFDLLSRGSVGVTEGEHGVYYTQSLGMPANFTPTLVALANRWYQRDGSTAPVQWNKPLVSPGADNFDPDSSDPYNDLTQWKIYDAAQGLNHDEYWITETLALTMLLSYNLRRYAPNIALNTEVTMGLFRQMFPYLPPFNVVTTRQNNLLLEAQVLRPVASTDEEIYVHPTSFIPDDVGGGTNYVITVDNQEGYEASLTVTAKDSDDGKLTLNGAVGFAIKVGEPVYRRALLMPENVVVAVQRTNGAAPFQWIATEHEYNLTDGDMTPSVGMFAFRGNVSADPPSIEYGSGVYGGPFKKYGAQHSTLTAHA